MTVAREMRMRIRSVENVAQITRALEAVSTTRVRKLQNALRLTQPYAEGLRGIVVHFLSQADSRRAHPFLVSRHPVRQALAIVIGGDRGLAGAYHANVVRQVRRHFSILPFPVEYLVVGSKGAYILQRHGENIISEFPGFTEPPTFKRTLTIGQVAIQKFLEQEVDEVWLAYTEFVNMSKQVPLVVRLLPLSLDDELHQVKKEGQRSHLAYTYEPNVEEILHTILPRFIEAQIHQAILSSLASEHASRAMTMRNATTNAQELMAQLQLEYNKARQQAITGELLDVAGGAEALVQTGA